MSDGGRRAFASSIMQARPGDEWTRHAGVRATSEIGGAVTMLHLALLFLILSVLAGIVGFAGVGNGVALGARIALLVFLLLFIVFAVASSIRATSRD
jgi:uncharacterized membrane protein YtjA (UPF0391 family)